MSFLSSVKKEFNSAAKSVSQEVDYLKNSIDENKTSPLLSQFSTGNVVQLVSRSSGKTLQIVMSSSGQLVVDGCGPEGPQVFHGHWTVINEGKNIIKLHNNNNFLAVNNGITQVYNYSQTPMTAGVECKFRLKQTDQFVRLESVKEPSRHVGILSTGELKSALATGKENDSQFGVRLIFASKPPAPAKK